MENKDSTPSLEQQIANMRQSFFDEDILDKHFEQLEQLQELDSPNFVEEVMTMYLHDSGNLIASVEKALETPFFDIFNIDKSLHQLKGSSASVGASKVRIETNKTREWIKAGDIGGTKIQFQQVKRAHETLKGKFEAYLQLLRQVGTSVTAKSPK